MEYLTFFITIFTSFLSAIIGGVFVLLGTIISYYFQRKRDEIKQTESIKNFLKAISVELQSLMKKAEEFINNLFEVTDSETPSFFQFYTSEDYFVVYDKNASLVGHLSNESLRNNIVKIYIDLKAFSDTLKVYKENYDRYYLSLLLPIETEPLRKIREAAVKANTENLNGSIPHLKKMYSELNDNVTNLIKEIDSFLVKIFSA